LLRLRGCRCRCRRGGLRSALRFGVWICGHRRFGQLLRHSGCYSFKDGKAWNGGQRKIAKPPRPQQINHLSRALVPGPMTHDLRQCRPISSRLGFRLARAGLSRVLPLQPWLDAPFILSLSTDPACRCGAPERVASSGLVLSANLGCMASSSQLMPCRLTDIRGFRTGSRCSTF
jgi:hypothetical protein